MRNLFISGGLLACFITATAQAATVQITDRYSHIEADLISDSYSSIGYYTNTASSTSAYADQISNVTTSEISFSGSAVGNQTYSDFDYSHGESILSTDFIVSGGEVDYDFSLDADALIAGFGGWFTTSLVNSSSQTIFTYSQYGNTSLVSGNFLFNDSGTLSADTYTFSIVLNSSGSVIEYSDISATAQLNLIATPLPAPIWLFISGITALLIGRRKQGR